MQGSDDIVCFHVSLHIRMQRWILISVGADPQTIQVYSITRSFLGHEVWGTQVRISIDANLLSIDFKPQRNLLIRKDSTEINVLSIHLLLLVCLLLGLGGTGVHIKNVFFTYFSFLRKKVWKKVSQ